MARLMWMKIFLLHESFYFVNEFNVNLPKKLVVKRCSLLSAYFLLSA